MSDDKNQTVGIKGEHENRKPIRQRKNKNKSRTEKMEPIEKQMLRFGLKTKYLGWVSVAHEKPIKNSQTHLYTFQLFKIIFCV